MSIATLLSQHHQVTAVDIIPEKVDMINNRKSPIQDDYIGVIVDLTACWSYCSYKNYKEISKKLAVQTAEGKEQLEKKNQQKESLKQTVILLLFRWLESIIRLNLLITAYFPSHHVRNFLYAHKEGCAYP